MKNMCFNGLGFRVLIVLIFSLSGVCSASTVFNSTNWNSGSFMNTSIKQSASVLQLNWALQDYKGYWTFDENTGAIARDEVKNNNCTISGTTWVSGKYGSALKYSKDSSIDSVNCGKTGLSNLSALTLSFWANVTSLGRNNYGAFLTKGIHGSAGSWELISGGPVLSSETTDPYFVVRYGDGSAAQALSRVCNNGSYSFNTWNHFLITWDGSSAASNIHIYINNAECSYGIAQNGTGSRGSDAGGNLTIGNSDSGENTLNGSIDDVRIFDHVVTATERSQIIVNSHLLKGNYTTQYISASGGSCKNVTATFQGGTASIWFAENSSANFNIFSAKNRTISSGTNYALNGVLGYCQIKLELATSNASLTPEVSKIEIWSQGSVTSSSTTTNPTTTTTATTTTTLAGTISSCGSITSSGAYTLSKSITNASTCIKVLANNVELNGNGYSVNFSTSLAGYGVDAAGRTNVTIRGFKFLNAPSGTYVIYASGAHGIVIKDNRMSTALSAAFIYNSDRCVVQNNSINITGDGSAGILIYNSNISSVIGNTVRATGMTGDGISLYGSNNNNVTNNVLFGSTGWGVIGFGASGNYNRIINNSIIATGSYEAGMYLEDTNYNTIENNTILCNNTDDTSQGGIYFISSDYNNVTRNIIRTTKGNGYGLEFGTSSEYNILRNNSLISDGMTGSGVYLRPGASSNIFVNNSMSATGTSGTGAYLESVTGNSFSGGYVSSTNGPAYYLRDAADTNNFSQTSFNGYKGIYFYDASSQFNYKNDSSNLQLTTKASAGDTFSRNLIKWSSSNITWNDSAAVTGIYVITGLSASKNYSIYNNSVKKYTLTSSANGRVNFSLPLRPSGNVISVNMDGTNTTTTIATTTTITTSSTTILPSSTTTTTTTTSTTTPLCSLGANCGSCTGWVYINSTSGTLQALDGDGNGKYDRVCCGEIVSNYTVL